MLFTSAMSSSLDMHEFRWISSSLQNEQRYFLSFTIIYRLPVLRLCTYYVPESTGTVGGRTFRLYIHAKEYIQMCYRGTGTPRNRR